MERQAITLTRRHFVRVAGVAGMTLLGGGLLAGCGESRGSSGGDGESAPSTEPSPAPAPETTPAPAAELDPTPGPEPAPAAPTSDTIIIYFSRADENYGVGYITEGNTAVLAKMIAEETGADIFVSVTAVPYAYLNYGLPSQEPIHKITPTEIKNLIKYGYFKPGSMLPKVEAAIAFAKKPSRIGIITDIAHLEDALQGKSGTIIAS